MKIFFSCEKFTIYLAVMGDVITEAAPIVRRFRGQRIVDLVRWVKGRGWGPIRIEALYKEYRPELKELLGKIIRELKT